jgi:hypothetical protein
LEGQTSPRIDLLPVREKFRALRHRFRQNGRLIRRATNKVRMHLPFPAVTTKVLAEFEGAVKGVERLASNLGRRLLKGSTAEILTNAPSLRIGDNSKLAGVAYSALSSIIGHFGIKGAYVSEAAARNAFASVNARSDLRQSETAAALMLSLLDEKAVTFSAEGGGQPLEEPVIVFALLLWLQSDCDDPYTGEALHAASDISVALTADIAESAASRDEKRLAGLFEEFSPHV